MTNAELALNYVTQDSIVGLGTGRAATAFIELLAVEVGRGLRVRGVPTSERSAGLARKLGIPLTTLEEVDCRIDVTVDGADEFDPNLNLIKGLGGALLREKVVGAASQRLVILIGPENVSEKRTACVGTRGVLPIEIVPFALRWCLQRLTAMSLSPRWRRNGEQPAITDNGNYLLDCHVAPLLDPRAFEREVCHVAGVVETGLFLDMASDVIVQDGDRVEVMQRPCA